MDSKSTKLGSKGNIDGLGLESRQTFAKETYLN